MILPACHSNLVHDSTLDSLPDSILDSILDSASYSVSKPDSKPIQLITQLIIFLNLLLFLSLLNQILLTPVDATILSILLFLSMILVTSVSFSSTVSTQRNPEPPQFSSSSSNLLLLQNLFFLKKISQYQDVFSESSSNKLPPHRPYDCHISLVKDSNVIFMD